MPWRGSARSVTVSAIILSGRVESPSAINPGKPHADRHARARLASWASWRSFPAARPWSMPYAQGAGGGAGHPAGPAARVLVAEAELGERIMRALILRRVGLLETGAGGPVIVGRAGNGDVLRLENFLAPQRPSAPAARPRDRCRGQGTDRTLPRRSGPAARSCCARTDSCCAIPARASSRAASAWWARSIPTASMTSPSSAPDRRGSPPRSMPPPKGFRSWCSDCRAFGGQAGASARIENYLGFPTGHHRHGADGARLQPGAEVRGRNGDPRRGCAR